MAELKAMQALAKEMNEVMGLNPKIKFTAVKADALELDIINNACGIDPETGDADEANAIAAGDTFTDEAWATLALLLDPEVEAQAGVFTIANDKCDDIAEAAKGRAAAAPAKAAAAAKPAKAEKPAKAPKVVKEKPVKAPKEPKFTRATAFKQIITAGPKTKEQMDAEMVKIYGGSEKEAVFQNYNFIRVLVEMGFLRLNEDKTYELVG